MKTLEKFNIIGHKKHHVAALLLLLLTVVFVVLCIVVPSFAIVVVIVPVPDPRAGMCPLLFIHDKIDRRFYRAVRRAGEYLLRDEDTRRYLLDLSAEIRNIAELAGKL